MTLNELQQESVKLEPKYLTRGEEALLGLLGLNSASGKCLELYRKTLFEGDAMTSERLLEALGEVVCYVAITAHSSDIELDKVMRKAADMVRMKLEEKDSDAGDEMES